MSKQKPTLVQAIAWMTITSGVVNLFWGLAASGTALATIVGVICTPLTILPTILGVFELIYAAKLFSNPPQIVQPSTNIAVFEIASVLTGNVFSMAVGILALVFYNDAVVKNYFTSLNRTPATVTPSTPSPSASIPDPESSPASEESNPNETEGQQTEDPPVKPKRAPRKVAKK